MKWIALAPMIVFLAACGCCTSPGVLEYRSVTYTPTVVAAPAVIARPRAVVVRPIYYDPVTIIDSDPIDVTTTTIDYY
ncbi:MULTISPECIES: hypothetical protein [Legionella]|uniref:Lipoprotein n=1 Tax=Legionella drozanskii LLAP-1 TaxID=1212489 RepID=A0A0W0SX16_9GAMM|nr:MULTISPECIES: hypothetical protein [Legionella]KTC87857.1 hypothetical protein Ldro_1476 [Legionella drozanskii LLAP-1]PJE09080.1 MAG: hypothetical protein CK430_11390 [Legionella sp.]